MPLTDAEIVKNLKKQYDNANTIKSKLNDIRQIVNHFKPDTISELINIDIDELKKFLEEKYTKTSTQSSIANSLFTLSSIIKGKDESQDLYKLAKNKWVSKNIDQVRGMNKQDFPISVKNFINKMTAFIKNKDNDPYERFIAGMVYHLPRRIGAELNKTLLVSNDEFNKLKPTTREGLFNIETYNLYRYTSKNKEPIDVFYNFVGIKNAIEDGALEGRKYIFNQTSAGGINNYVKKLMDKIIGAKVGTQVLRQYYTTRREGVSNEEYKKDAIALGHSVSVHSTYVNRNKLDKMSPAGKELYIESRELIDDILINLNDATKLKELKQFTEMIKKCHQTIIG